MLIFQQIRISRLENELWTERERLSRFEEDVLKFMANTNSSVNNHSEAIENLSRAVRLAVLFK